MRRPRPPKRTRPKLFGRLPVVLVADHRKNQGQVVARPPGLAVPIPLAPERPRQETHEPPGRPGPRGPPLEIHHPLLGGEELGHELLGPARAAPEFDRFGPLAVRVKPDGHQPTRLPEVKSALAAPDPPTGPMGLKPAAEVSPLGLDRSPADQPGEPLLQVLPDLRQSGSGCPGLVDRLVKGGQRLDLGQHEKPLPS